MNAAMNRRILIRAFMLVNADHRIKMFVVCATKDTDVDSGGDSALVQFICTLECFFVSHKLHATASLHAMPQLEPARHGGTTLGRLNSAQDYLRTLRVLFNEIFASRLLQAGDGADCPAGDCFCSIRRFGGPQARFAPGLGNGLPLRFWLALAFCLIGRLREVWRLPSFRAFRLSAFPCYLFAAQSTGRIARKSSQVAK